jgi:cell division protein FtsI (penicillin-binding protein 3)
MSAKDAVELLHSMGLKVRLTGYGKVVSQTPSAGTAAKKGTLVMLKLVKS